MPNELTEIVRAGCSLAAPRKTPARLLSVSPDGGAHVIPVSGLTADQMLLAVSAFRIATGKTSFPRELREFGEIHKSLSPSHPDVILDS